MRTAATGSLRRAGPGWTATSIALRGEPSGIEHLGITQIVDHNDAIISASTPFTAAESIATRPARASPP